MDERGISRARATEEASEESSDSEVVDVSNPASTNIMATQFTPDQFTHNCWLSDDGNTLYTTDEVSGAFVTSYDVSDILNISELDRVQSNPGSGTIPHNAFVVGERFNLFYQINIPCYYNHIFVISFLS